MRKILSLLGTIVLSTSTSASIIACDSGEEKKCKNLNLKTVITNKTINFIFWVNVHKLYNELNLKLISKIRTFDYISLKDGYEIKYYSDEEGKNEVTADYQKVANVYFTIAAAEDDPNWEGTTDILSSVILKGHMPFVSQNEFPTDFQKQAENSKIYSDLGLYIISNCSYFKNTPLKDGYEIKYYSDEEGKNEVTADYQKVANVYFMITAAEDDPNWEGTTLKIKLELT